jgi:hypothetical protein
MAANSDLEYIIENIGENKVNLHIASNEFIETADVTVQHEKKYYDKLPNLLTNYKQLKVTKPWQPNNFIDNVLYICMKNIDESLTLVSNDTLKQKLDTFKKELGFFKERWQPMSKKLAEFKIVAMFMKKNIAVFENSDWELYECGDVNIDETLMIDINCDCGKVVSKEECKKLIIKHRLSKKENLNINTLLVKDLKDLATELYIPVICPQKKKPYLKNELKELITEKINNI